MRFWVFIKEELQKIFENNKESDPSESDGESGIEPPKDEENKQNSDQTDKEGEGQTDKKDTPQSGEQQAGDGQGEQAQGGEPQDVQGQTEDSEGQREQAQGEEPQDEQGQPDKKDDSQLEGQPQDEESQAGGENQLDKKDGPQSGGTPQAGESQSGEEELSDEQGGMPQAGNEGTPIAKDEFNQTGSAGQEEQLQDEQGQGVEELSNHQEGMQQLTDQESLRPQLGEQQSEISQAGEQGIPQASDVPPTSTSDIPLEEPRRQGDIRPQYNPDDTIDQSNSSSGSSSKGEAISKPSLGGTSSKGEDKTSKDSKDKSDKSRDTKDQIGEDSVDKKTKDEQKTASSGIEAEKNLPKNEDGKPEEASSKGDESKNPDDAKDGEEEKDKGLKNDEGHQEEKSEEQSGDQVQKGEPQKSKKDQIEELKELKSEVEAHREDIEKQGASQHDKERITGDAKGSDKTTEEHPEEQYELGDQANKFLEQLGELPNFKNRSRGPGYSIDTRGYTKVPDSVIRTLITKFLNQRFCKRDTDLNVRSNSLDEARGFYKWKVRDVIVHLETEQVTKVLNDKFGYQYANGKNETVPLSFYFDLSGSMSKYTNLLAVIAIELLKKGVKVLVGFNERVNVQIDKVDEHITVSEFAKILSTAGYASWETGASKSRLKRNKKISMKFIDRDIDNYLIEKKAEKCVAFSDFDAITELSNLSHVAQVYYFCFESDFSKADLDDFKGFVYQVENINDIESGLVKVNSNRFETLCYTLKNKKLQKKLGE